MVIHLNDPYFPMDYATPTFAQVETSLNSENSKKLGPHLKLRLSKLTAGENPVVGIILRCHSHLEAQQQSQLEDAGAHLHTIAGDIITATLPIQQIFQLVTFSFIAYIELSTPLHLEK